MSESCGWIIVLVGLLIGCRADIILPMEADSADSGDVSPHLTGDELCFLEVDDATTAAGPELCTIKPVEDGWLHFAVFNPDASSDGFFFVIEETLGRLPNLYQCRGTPPFYEHDCDEGIDTYELYVDVDSGVALSFELTYFGTAGDELRGPDALTVTFEPGRSIQDARGEEIVSLMVEDFSGSEMILAEAQASSSGAGVLLDASLTGTGGGSHLLYADGVSLAAVRTGDTPLWGPVAIPLESRQRDWLLTFEDDDTADNVGPLRLDVFDWSR